MALKFFRTGVHSASMHAIRGLDAQDSTNFFRDRWSNHIAETRKWDELIFFAMFASGKTRFPLTVGTKDFATYGQDGQKVSDVKFPFRLVFEG